MRASGEQAVATLNVARRFTLEVRLPPGAGQVFARREIAIPGSEGSISGLEAGGSAAAHAAGACQPSVLSQPCQGGCQRVPIPDARSGGPDPGMGPHSPRGGEELVGQILHESVALTGEGGRARRGHSGRWLLSSADGDIPHTLLGSPGTTFWDQVVGVFFSSLCFWKPDRCPSEKALSCHSLAMGLVSMGLIQRVRGGTATCAGKAKQTPSAPCLAGSTAQVCSAPADSSMWEYMRRQKQVGKIIASSPGHYESHTPSVIPQTPNLPFQAEVCVEPKVQLSKPVRRLIPPPALTGVQKS